MKDWKTVKSLIDEEAERIRFSEPDEVKKIFQYGVIESQAGSYGQYFTTMVFAEGDCRALAYYNVNNLIFVFDETSFTLEQMKFLIKLYLPLGSEFLGYCGFNKLWEFVQAVLDCVDSIKSKEELKELITSLSLYAANLHAWVHHKFPWNAGALFPRKNLDEIKEMARLARLK
jgi:hypothetical protein